MRTEALNRIDPERIHRIANLTAHYSALGLAWDRGNNHAAEKPVIVNGVLYSTSSEAAAAIGVGEGTIREVCRGQRTTKRFTARWAE